MKKLCLLCLLAVFCFGAPFEWHNLNENQKKFARLIYKLVDDKDLRLTLIAIAWQESRLNEAPVNLQDPSCSAFHILIPVYLSQNNISDNAYNRNLHCGKLINDPVLSVRTAEKALNIWLKHHKGDLNKAIQSYNGGYNYNSNAAKGYLNGILKHRRAVLDLVENGVLK